MQDVLLAIIVIGSIFIGMPWIVLHYVTQWKRNQTLSVEDEQLLDDLYETARRLDDRLDTIERIVAADHPDFRPRRSTVSDTREG